VPAERIAERGEHFFRERLVLPGSESREESRGERGNRHVLFKRIRDHPAPLARILHEAFEFVEFGIVLQGVDRQFQQRRVAVRILTAAEEPAPVNRGS